MDVIRILHYNRTYFHYNRLILYEQLCVRLIANTGNALSNVRDAKICVVVNLCAQNTECLKITDRNTHNQYNKCSS